MGNRRQGICVNASQVGISLSGNLCADNASNYFLRGDYSSSNGDISSGGGAVFFMGRGNTVTGFISKNTVTISATNFFMNGGVIGGQAAPARHGAAADHTPLKVGMVIERPNLDRRVARVHNVRIRGVQFVGCKTAVRVDGVVENVRFTENRFGATDQAVEIGNECHEQVFFARNEGYATENRGTARIAGRDRTLTVAHGLNVTPALRDIVVTPTNDLGLAKKFWASRPTKTGFEIHVDTEPGENGADFVWQVSASKDQPIQ